MRTIIQIDEEEVKQLDKLCKEKGWSRAKGFREAVRKFLKESSLSEKNNNPKNALEEYFGCLKDSFGDGLQYQVKIREEWDEREKELYRPYNDGDNESNI
jgi:hypothetical protein